MSKLPYGLGGYTVTVRVRCRLPPNLPVLAVAGEEDEAGTGVTGGGGGVALGPGPVLVVAHRDEDLVLRDLVAPAG